MKDMKIGLLPLYLELYDNANPGLRERINAFLAKMSGSLKDMGLEVVDVPVCRLKAEFADAVKRFEEENVDAIVTLHLAYSPSLESAEVLAATKLPIIVLDTTETYDFGPQQERTEVSYNHGIHGVQDMCNLLIRNGKSFVIEAGHWQNSDVLKRVYRRVRSAKLAQSMKNTRAGLIGDSFKGMGDFLVPADVLKSSIGVELVKGCFDTITSIMNGISKEEIDAEIENDRKIFDAAGVTAEAHERSVRAGLAVRKWIEKENLSAFSMNFLAFTASTGMPTVPFLEASKAMARGIGYAGEGDVLTASLVGALSKVYPGTTFTEIFCPDWENNTIFLSHMGEVNVSLASDKPVLYEMKFAYTDVEKPITAAARLRGGKAVFINLAPRAGGRYALILAPVEVVDVQGQDKMGGIRGWIKPPMPISDFLEKYSYAGGTHHSAMVYDADMSELEGFAKLMDWTVEIIK